ncbi:hypothetical protein [Pleionea sediminis]|uniref:hypothetical protein n=1 Tax=Pleionea sediminis TaxID=2569479 RepID=UPI0011868DCB|nr:hypothetical protein [Pleionea sediminis]
MFGLKRAIRNYIERLPAELGQFGEPPYTREQVDVAVRRASLNDKHIHYAYFIHCNQMQHVNGIGVDNGSCTDMRGTIESAIAPGFLSSLILGASFGGSSDSSGDSCDFSGGAE